MLWLFAGGAIGVLHVLSVRLAVTRLQPRAPRRALAAVLGGAILRSALAAAVLAIAFHQGFTPGILALAGMWVCRWGAIRRLCADRRPAHTSPLEIRG